ncbi:MAG: radical SAM protein, partial [Syntrophales bacterium]
IKEDIRKAKDIADQVRELSWKHGGGGRISKSIVNLIYSHDEEYSDTVRSITAWLYYGGESVFIQDANSIIMKTDALVEILAFIKDKFPSVNRITSYCRSKTAARKTVEEFKMLKSAGLSRIHIGMESGYDHLLQFVKKGVTASEHIKGGRNVKEAGISLCEYVMPGLGGDRWSTEHAEETARVINEINPDFVRLRTFHAVPGTDLFDMVESGEFNPIGDEEILREIRRFIECLHGIDTTVVSDHILNLLEDLQGKLPEDKEHLLAIIDGYFSLPDDERLVYRIGRRLGTYRGLADLSDEGMYKKVRSIIDQYCKQDRNQLNNDLLKIMNRYI